MAITHTRLPRIWCSSSTLVVKLPFDRRATNLTQAMLVNGPNVFDLFLETSPGLGGYSFPSHLQARPIVTNAPVPSLHSPSRDFGLHPFEIAVFKYEYGAFRELLCKFVVLYRALGVPLELCQIEFFLTH